MFTNGSAAAVRYGRELAWLFVSLAVYTVITALYFSPLLAHLDSQLLGPPEDNLQDLWNLWHVVSGGVSGDTFFFTRAIRFPEGTSLAYHSIAYPEVYFALPFAKALGATLPTLITVENLTILASFPLAGVGAFYLARHFVGNAPVT